MGLKIVCFSVEILVSIFLEGGSFGVNIDG